MARELETRLLQSTEFSITTRNKLLSIREKIDQKISKEVDIAGVSLFRLRALHQIIPHIKPEYAPDFEDKFTEIMKDPDVIPILLSSHQGWADAITMALTSRKLTRMINKARGFDDSVWQDIKVSFAGNLLQKPDPEKKRFKGFVLTIAKSLDIEGKGQGPFIEELQKQAQSWFHEHFLTTDGFVREKDKEKYGLSGIINKKHNLKMVQDIREGTTGRAFFPEASVEGGRISAEEKNGNHNNIKGMQKFDTSIKYDRLLEHIQKAGKKAVFLTVGSHGAFRIIDPNTKKPIPTWEAWIANFNPLNTYVISDFMKAFTRLMVDIEIKGLMEVKIGMPIKAEDIVREIIENRKGQFSNEQKPTSEEISSYLGKKIAALLPPEARGVYA